MLDIHPNLKSVRFWLSFPIRAFIILGILQLIYGGSMLSVKSVLLSIPLLAIAQIISYTLLQIGEK